MTFRGLRTSQRAFALEAVAWPDAQRAEALCALARASGLLASGAEYEHPPVSSAEQDDVDAHLADTASRLGLEVEAIHASCGEATSLVRRCGPALLQLPSARRAWLCVVGTRRGRVALLAPDGRRRCLSARFLVRALSAELHAQVEPAIDELLRRSQIGGRRAVRARVALVQERIAGRSLAALWLICTPPGASFAKQLAERGLLRRALAFFAAHALAYALFLGSWWVLGAAALAGRFEAGWLSAWILLIATALPVSMASRLLESDLSVRLGTLLRRRLFHGATELRPDSIRREGMGQLLGRVLESEGIEANATSGGLLAGVAGIELLFAAWILSQGAAATAQLLALALWAAATGALCSEVLRARQRWTRTRLGLAHALVEQIVGQRTRQIQERGEREQREDDARLSRYLADSRRLDRAQGWLLALAPRAWMLLGVAVLAASFASGAAAAELAVSLGGLLVAYRGFSALADGFGSLAAAGIAAQQAAPLLRTKPRPYPAEATRLPTRVGAPRGTEPLVPLLEADSLTFQHRGRPRAVLENVTLKIQAGERLLLVGASGSGKSTLAALLCGLREPASGLLLLHGLDRSVTGWWRWRRAVVAVPQFHENYVFTHTLAFNLLMGRGWPPSQTDLAHAAQICAELGLGPLLERMPAGLHQTVGEGGWRLSHGECSRLYLARALLQDPELLVLDEQLGALDPETLELALQSLLKRARTLLVAGHP